MAADSADLRQDGGAPSESDPRRKSRPTERQFQRSGAESARHRGRTVVYAWGYLPTSDACGASEIKASPLTNNELVVQQLGGSRKVVAHGGCPADGNVSLLGQPQLTSTTTLTYVVWRAHSGTGFVRRLDLADRRRHDAVLGSFYPESFATDGQGTSILSVEDAHAGGTRITSTQLAFAG